MVKEEEPKERPGGFCGKASGILRPEIPCGERERKGLTWKVSVNCVFILKAQGSHRGMSCRNKTTFPS